ncbi:MAG: NAD-dependent epimerase/dehydratase family protein [Acidimicrobiales bacterium]
MSQRVLVTGAAGRLGRAVTARLADEGYHFLATDIVDPGEVTFPFQQADLMDHTTASRLLRGIDVVMHFGNHPGIGATPPQVVFNENTTMNTNVFQGAAEQGVDRIIFASTLQLIGSHIDGLTVVKPPPDPTFPLRGDTVARPANLYALSKVVAEQQLQYYADRCGLECIALRFPMLHNHGPWVGVSSGDENDVDITEGFTGLSYRDAANLVLAVLRSDLPGYRCYMAGTAHRHNDLAIDALVRTFYPHLQPDIADLIDNTTITRETGWKISDDYQNPSSQDTSP